MRVHRNDIHVLDIIRPDMKNGPWIAGGAVLKWLNGQEVGRSDIDIFCTSAEQFEEVSTRILNNGYTRYFVTKFATTFKPMVVVEDTIYKTIDVTAIVAITKELEKPRCMDSHQLQAIRKDFYSCAEDVIDDFDLTCCQFVTDGNTVLHGKHSVKDMRNKILNINKHSKGILKRMVKYCSYGYSPSQETLDALSSYHNDLTLDFEWAEDYAP